MFLRLSIGAMAAACGAMALAGPSARAETIIVPEAFTTAPAESNFTTPIRNLPRVQHNYFDASVIGFSEPVQITGMAFRLDNVSPFAPGVPHPDAWPSVELTLERYEVLLAQPSQVVSDNNLLTTTFANNIGANATVVRTGTLTIEPLTYINDGTSEAPASFGPVITFDTPYLYTPGEDLLMEIRHTGFGDAEFLQPNFDASNQIALFNTRAATDSADATESLPNIFNTTVVQFTFQPVSAPLLPGDANRDGRVDGEDFLIWQASFGIQEGATWDDGDFNGDGRVDGEDFLIWQAHFGSVAESSAVTPEPVSLGLLFAAGLIALRRRGGNRW